MKIFNKKNIKISVIILFTALSVVFYSNVVEAKTDSRSCNYVHGYDCCGGAYPTKYKTVVTGSVSIDTDVSMSGGVVTSIPVSGTINFTKSLTADYSATGGYWDTPTMLVNGNWHNDTYNFYGGSRVGAQNIHDSNGLPGWVAWVADIHNYSNIYISSSNPSVMSCSGMSCTAVAPGTVTLTAHIPDYYARMRSWIRFNTPTTGSFPNALGGLYLSSYGTSWLHSNDCHAYSIRSGTYFKGVRLASSTLAWSVTVNPAAVAKCGTAAKTYPADAIGYSGTSCESPSTLFGTMGAFPSPGGTASWTCKNGSDTKLCTATVSGDLNGECNATINGHALPSKPTSGLCTHGTASAVTGGGTDQITDPWVWTCNGLGTGTNDSCSAYSSLTVSVSANPSPSAEITSPVRFTATASGGTQPYNFTWSMDVSGPGTDSSPTQNYIEKVFSVVGPKTAKVTVQDSAGGVVSGTAPVVIVDNRVLQ